MDQNNLRFRLERGRKVVLPSFLAYFLVVVFFLFPLLKCLTPEKDTPYQLEISREDSLRFELSSKTYGVRNLSVVQEDGNVYLLNNNYSLYDTVNQLEIYDLEGQKLVDRIDLMPDSLSYFTSVRDILYLNRDSIFYSKPTAQHPYHTSFIQMNRSGEVQESWTFRGSDPEWEGGNIVIGGTHIFAPLDHQKGSFYSPVLPQRSGLSGSVFGYANMVRLSLPKDDNAPDIDPFGGYPSIFRTADRNFHPEKSLQIVRPFLCFDHAMDERSIVLSFPFVDTLYRYDLQGELLEKKAAKSRKVSPQRIWGTFEDKGLEKLREQYPDRLKGIPHYFRLVYDPFRELYYRSVNLSAERSSLMILDEDLRYIRELSFKKAGGGHAFPFHCPVLPTKEAVYIPVKDPKGLYFRVLKIRKIASD